MIFIDTLIVTEPFKLITMVLLSHSLRFPDIDGTQKGDPARKYKLSWNPCTQFSDGDCKNVLVSNTQHEIQNLRIFNSCVKNRKYKAFSLRTSSENRKDA